MASNSGSRWMRDELVLAFRLYCHTPFGRIHVRNPDIVELAELLERTPGAVSYKLANFARLDPALRARGIRGMAHGGSGDEEVWRDFAEDGEALALESERVLAARLGQDIEQSVDPASIAGLEGREREATVRTRVNQQFFRRMVLARYRETCCVTGLTIRSLLVASHIVPWADAPEQRMNPRNGLCLNALHDRAFDRGLLTVTDDLRVRIAPSVRDQASPAAADLLFRFDGQPLRVPADFTPDPDLLRAHRARFAA